MNFSNIQTLELLPADGPPKQLFVLLHDAGGAAADMRALAEVMGKAFAQAVLVMPEGLSSAPVGEESLEQLNGRVEALAAFLRAQQERIGLLQSDTALLGFGAGASLALALSAAHDGLAGRVLAFGGTHAHWPTGAPQLTTLHLLHGEHDPVVPVNQAREAYERLMAMKADATLDVASLVGHELHPALMAQALVRLQTCVPLRYWKAL